MSKVLLIIDMQNGFSGAFKTGVVERIESYIRSGVYDSIVFTKFVNKPDSCFSRRLGYADMQENSGADLSICSKLQPYAVSVIEKHGYSAVKSQNFSRYVSHEDHVYVCGVETDASVLATLFDLFDLGYNFTLLQDAVSSEGLRPQDAAFSIIHRNIGVSELEDCV